TKEKIYRELKSTIKSTAPNVIYEYKKKDGDFVKVDNPSFMPDSQIVEEVYEPFVRAVIMVPNDFVGPVMELCQRKRGQFMDMQYLDDIREIGRASCRERAE